MVIAPLVEIVARPLTLDPAGYATLIFTSENGVRHFVEQTPSCGRPAFCVGPRTAAAAECAGFAVQPLTEAGGDAEALLRTLRAAGPALPLLHVRGEHAITDLAGRLEAEGLACDEAVVYAQCDRAPPPAALAALAGPAPVLLPLFSPRSARRAAQMLRSVGQACAGVAVAISAAAAARWQDALEAEGAEGTGGQLHLPGWSVAVAPRPDACGMMDALQGAMRRLAA